MIALQEYFTLLVKIQIDFDPMLQSLKQPAGHVIF